MALISQNFKNDTNTGSFSIEPVVVVADLVEDKYNVLDIYSTSSYWFKDQDNIDIKQSKDILNKVSSVKSVVDYESKKIKSNTFRFSINNYFDVNKKLTNSDDYSLTGGTSLNSLIGKHIILFYKTQTTENIYLLKDTNLFSTYNLEDDSKLCSIMFYGVINRVTQKKDIITIQAEDHTQDYIKDKELPANNVGSLPEEIKNNLIETDLDKPIPMVFGKVDHAPTISFKTNIPNTQGFISLGFIHDSNPIFGFNHHLAKSQSGATMSYHLFLIDDDDYVIVPYVTGRQPNIATTYFVDISDFGESAYIVPELHDDSNNTEPLYVVGYEPASTIIGREHTQNIGTLNNLTGLISDTDNLNNSDVIIRDYNKKNMWNGPVLLEVDPFFTEPTTISASDNHSQWFLVGFKRDLVISRISGRLGLYTSLNAEGLPDSNSDITNNVDYSLYSKPFDPEQFKLLFENISSNQYLNYILEDSEIDGQEFPNYSSHTTNLPNGQSYYATGQGHYGILIGPLETVVIHGWAKERYSEADTVNKLLFFDYANNTEDVSIGLFFKDLMIQYVKEINDYQNEKFYSAIQGRQHYFSTEPIANLNDISTSFNITVGEAIKGADNSFPDFESVVDEWDNYFASMYEVFPSADNILQDWTGDDNINTFLWWTLLSNYGTNLSHSGYDFAIKSGWGYGSIKNTCDSDDATIFSSPQIIETILHGLIKKLYANIWQREVYSDTEYWQWFREQYNLQYNIYPDDYYNWDINNPPLELVKVVCDQYKSRLKQEHLYGDSTPPAGFSNYLESWLEVPERTVTAMQQYSQYRRLLIRRILKYLYQSDLNDETSIDILVGEFVYDWSDFGISQTAEDGADSYIENLTTYLDDTISTINKYIYNKGSRLEGTMEQSDWNDLFPELNDDLRFGHRSELYVWNDSPDYISLEIPSYINLHNYIHLDSIMNECFSVFSQNNSYETSGFIEKPTDIFMNILLRELKYGVREEEIDSSAFDSTSIEKSRVYYDGWKMGFCLDEKKDAVSLLDDICKETKSVFNFNAEGKASIITIGNDYVYNDIDYTINKDDVSNYLITRTKREKIITSNKFYYRYDNGKGRYKIETSLLKAEDLYDGYDGYNYYNIEADITSQEKELRYHVDDTTVDDFLKYDLGQKINQHLLIDLELPLSYSKINLGSILHIPLLEDDKAFGIDYSTLQTLNGQTLLPIWIVTGIDITIERVKIKAMQLHHIKKTISDFTSFALPDVENIIIVNTTQDNSIYTYPNGSPVLNWNYVNPNSFHDEITVVDSGIEIPYGDVNGDQLINITDVVLMVNDILSAGLELSFYERARADISNDGVVDVVDVVIVVGIILGD